MTNYAVFESALLDLRTTPDRPLILITANNGGGKTSTLSAFRLALHGRRAFDSPVGEREYLNLMEGRFHRGRTESPCSLELEFSFLDQHVTRDVKLCRRWIQKRKNICEEVELLLDGKALDDVDVDDLLTSIVPPEVAKYFFFDGERVRELADWDGDDETQLFDAVSDLLGIKLIDQLGRDLLRVRNTTSASRSEERSVLEDLDEARKRLDRAKRSYLEERDKARRIRGSYERASAQLRRLGVLHAEELSQIRDTQAKLEAERSSLLEEATRASHDILPLLCARRMRAELGLELDRRREIEEREVVQRFLSDRAPHLREALKGRNISAADAKAVLEILQEAARGRPVALDHVLPSVSRTESAWMQRVVGRELPDLRKRALELVSRLRILDVEIERCAERIRSAPTDDPKSDSALKELEMAQRDLITHEAALNAASKERDIAEASIAGLEKLAREQRLAKFQQKRLLLRDDLLNRVADSLPRLASLLERSKQRRFSAYLLESLRALWHKVDRIDSVVTSFADRRIELERAGVALNKQDLSAGEKQLFASAFIYSLARLSGRHMPFVIDTPLGRLDYEHRSRFVAEFLPDASHQTILLSTDTEIVGSLYNEIEHLIAHKYELADYNGAVTTPVQLALAK